MRIMRLVRWLVLAALAVTLPVKSPASIFLSISVAPPPLPVYVQPLCPGEGYIWTPGYWAYGDYGFFWVPGTWVLVPEPGLLWTPGYWGWGDGVYLFHEGYWGPRVGFYGGIVYGFGYEGIGYQGGYWNRGVFFYNRSVNNVTNITNVCNKTVVVNNTTVNNVSYNGGSGGVSARPTAAEETAMRERHVPPNAAQARHLQSASTNRQLYESVNHGKPPIAATVKPEEFKGRGAVGARAAARSYTPPARRSAERPAAGNPTPHSALPVHPNDSPRTARPTVNTGSPNLDRKYQQQQQKLSAKQEQERFRLQQRQDQEHQRMPARANDTRSRQLEQRHQQQTRQMEQRQNMEQHKLQERQQHDNRNPRR